MSPSATDRNLLFGILALQTGFLDKDALVKAMNAWILEKAKPLGQILQEQTALTAAEAALLEGLVCKHLEKHGDPQQSLAALSAPGSVRDELRQLADADLNASLAVVARDRGDEADSQATQSHVLAPGATVRFVILRPHARGGLGEVHVATDTELHREVALKEIQERHADNPESRARFLLEAEITGRLEHPGIVPVYGLGTYADGRPFYAMRFIKGDSLKEAITRFHKPQAHGWPPVGFDSLELRALLRRFVDVCNAVAYAHSRGVLHRDLKPGNVMLGKYGETLVVDWGLAKATDQVETSAATTEEVLKPSLASGPAPTQMGKALGTPAYMSPEQAAGRLDLLGPASDVYSLGATLYVLLTGIAPFKEDAEGGILRRVQRGEFTPPRQVNGQVPRALEAVCLKAMAREPGQRYATPRALADDVERWLADEPVSAFREPLRQRLGRWLRRHRTLVSSAVVLLAVAAVALAVSTLLIGDALRNEEQARKQEEQARKERALAQVEAVLTANPRAVPALLDGLKSTRADVLPRLRELWESSRLAPRVERSRRVRVGLALLALDGGAINEPLHDWILQADDPQEVLLLRDVLRPQRATLAPALWQALDAAKRSPKQRFQALVALAAFDSGNARWRQSGAQVVKQLLTENPLHLGLWVEALRPVRAELLTPLAQVFRGQALPGKADVAMEILADYAADQPALLTELVLDADARQWAVLFPRLRPHAEQAVPLLHQELAKTAQADWKDAPLKPAWPTPTAALVTQVEAAGGMVGERFAFCQTLPLEQFAALAEGLRKCGYSPTRLRPFAAGEKVLAAAVWTRDGRRWEMALGATAEEVTKRDEEARGRRLVARDVAGYLVKAAGKEEAANRYAALWAEPSLPGEETGLYTGVEAAKHRAAFTPYQKKGFAPLTMQVCPAAGGGSLHSSVWGKSKVAVEEATASWDLSADKYVDFFRPHRNLQRDVSLAATAPAAGAPPSYAGVWQASAAFNSEELHGLTPQKHHQRCRGLVAAGYRPTAVSVAGLEDAKGLTVASVWYRPIVGDAVKDALARRQAQAAVALAQLGQAEAVWPLLKHTPDPSRRSHLLHLLGRLKSDPAALLARLELGTKLEVSERRALILALGEFSAEQLPAALRLSMRDKLLQWYREDADAGIHAAIDWLLRHGKQGPAARKLDWGQGAALAKIDAELAGQEAGKRDWYVSAKEGHTFSVFREPSVFLMGSPPNEPERLKNERLHWRQIPRSFAIASKAVTVGQFRRFLEATPAFKGQHNYLAKYAPEDECPQIEVTWYEAAAYCNWLSQQEGIPEDQWVYPKDRAAIKEGMVLEKGYLSKKGYRLPTEAEWEYAARAGAETRRFYGGSEGLLGEYAWFAKNSGGRTWPVGQLKPNDLGLFDALGNLFQWCQTRNLIYPTAKGRQGNEDIEDILYIADEKFGRVLRGGSFFNQGSTVRCAARSYYRPADRYNILVGLRPARTYP